MAKLPEHIIKDRLTLQQAVCYQIGFWGVMEKVSLTPLETLCLGCAFLNPGLELNRLCEAAATPEWGKTTPQSARNTFEKLSSKKLIIKSGKNKKKVCVSDRITLFSQSLMVLTYKFLVTDGTGKS
jgi:hypothetical protein